MAKFQFWLLTCEQEVSGEVVHGEVVDVESGEDEGVEIFQTRRRQEHDHVPLRHEQHLAWKKYEKSERDW